MAEPVYEIDKEEPSVISKILRKIDDSQEKDVNQRRLKIVQPINVPVVLPQVSPSLVTGQVNVPMFQTPHYSQQQQVQQQRIDPQLQMMMQEQRRLEREQRMANVNAKVNAGFSVKSNLSACPRIRKVDMVQPRINVNKVVQPQKRRRGRK